MISRDALNRMLTETSPRCVQCKDQCDSFARQLPGQSLVRIARSTCSGGLWRVQTVGLWLLLVLPLLLRRRLLLLLLLLLFPRRKGGGCRIVERLRDRRQLLLRLLSGSLLLFLRHSLVLILFLIVVVILQFKSSLYIFIL